MRWKEIVETATAGASAAGGVASVAQPLGGVQRRSGVYTNHTVVGPDGRPWGNSTKKKKKKKSNLQEYKMIKTDEGKVFINPSAQHMLNLVDRSRFDEIRGLYSTITGINYVWDSGNATHDEVFKFLTEYGYESGGMPRFIIWKKGDEYKFEGPKEVLRNNPRIQKVVEAAKNNHKNLNEAQEQHPLDVLRYDVETQEATIDTLAMMGFDEYWHSLRDAGLISKEDQKKYEAMNPKQLEQAFKEYHGVSSKELIKQKEAEEEKQLQGLPAYSRRNIEDLASKMTIRPIDLARNLENMQYYVKGPKTVVVFDPEGRHPAAAFPRSEEDWLQAGLVEKVPKPKRKKTGPLGGYD